MSLFFSLVTAGCKAQQNAPTLSESPVFILFQKTPCYGTCPAYEATIYENGSITFVGWEHVPVKDTLQLQLPVQQLKALRHEVAQLNYSSLQDSYLTQWTDMPATITTFYSNGRQAKRVKHQEGGPQNLLQFQERLHQQIMKLVEAEAKKLLPQK